MQELITLKFGRGGGGKGEGKKKKKQARKEQVLGHDPVVGQCPEFYGLNTCSPEPERKNHNRRNPCQL